MSGDPVVVAADGFWFSLPQRLIARVPSAWGFVGDAQFMTVVPPLGVVAPVIVAVGALVVGATGAGFDTVYTESLAFMVAMVAMGCFSTQLGLVALVSFAAGEFFLAERAWALEETLGAAGGPLSTGLIGNLVRVRLPLIVTYLLLAVPVAIVPRTARGLVVAVGQRRRLAPGITWALSSGLYVMVVWIGVRTWTAAAPTLVRPRFTWLDGSGSPTAQAIQPLQAQGATIVAAAVVAAIVRQVISGWLLLPGTRQQAVRDRLSAAAAAVRKGTLRQPLPRPSRGRRLGGDALAAMVATLTLAGILERAWLWVVAFGVMLGVRLLRSEVIARGAVRRWKEVTARLPAAARLVALWVLARVVTDALSKGVIESYTAMALFVIAGVVGVFMVFPGTPSSPGREPAAPVPQAAT